MLYQVSPQHNKPQHDESSWATLVIFCKRPELGFGKQRLAQSIGSEQALVIAEALFNCTLEDALAWTGPVVIACSDNKDLLWAQSLSNNFEVIAQGDVGNLGQRINHVDKSLRALGHEHIIIIGTDAPMLNQTYFESAMRSLITHDIVLSEADDGGVVIMANKQPWPCITDLPWSTERLANALATTCVNEQLSVGHISSNYDIDYVDDIKKLALDLKNDHRPARQSLLTRINQLSLNPGVANHA